jgi:hypothetical protein
MMKIKEKRSGMSKKRRWKKRPLFFTDRERRELAPQLFYNVFEIMIAMTIQSIFYLEMYQNKKFYFFKNYFWYQYIKMIWKYNNYFFILSKKTNLKFKGPKHK